MLLGLITLFRYETGNLNLNLKRFNMEVIIVRVDTGNASKYYK